VVAEAAATGALEGLVVVADFQTAGRGRLERSWEATPGDALLVSVLLRPTHLELSRWHLLSAAAALAARFACIQVAGVDAKIKWPNDLLAGAAGSKLAGILAEATLGSSAKGAGKGDSAVDPGDTTDTVGTEGQAAVVVGMGLNVHGGPPGSAVLDHLARRRVSRSELLSTWLVDLDRRLDDFEQVAGDYARECDTVARRVNVDRGGGRTLCGVATSVDAAGRLVVRAQSGGEVALSVGDVTHLR
jgi:BirA family biotin operon repressor/biotin-[acetyl-CoA-carboxylase] ligase